METVAKMLSKKGVRDNDVLYTLYQCDYPSNAPISTCNETFIQMKYSEKLLRPHEKSLTLWTVKIG